MSLHTCQFSVCVEDASHVITYVPVLCMCGACVPCHYICAISLYVWSMCPMSLHMCHLSVCVEHVSHVITYMPVFCMCVEHVSHVITYVPVLCIESIKTTSIEDVSTRLLEKIKNIQEGMCGAYVPCHYIRASSLYVWSMCPMSLHMCQFSVCVEDASHVITYVPVLCMCGACVPCHYICAISLYVWSMCPMSLHT